MSSSNNFSNLNGPSPYYSIFTPSGDPNLDAAYNVAVRPSIYNSNSPQSVINALQPYAGSVANGVNSTGTSKFWDFLANNVWGTVSDAASNVWDSLVGTDGSGGFFNNNNYLGWAQLGVGGYLGLQQLGLLKDSLNLSRDQWNTQKDYLAKNYANSVSDYNRAINDIANNREKILGRPGYAEQYKKDYSIS